MIFHPTVFRCRHMKSLNWGFSSAFRGPKDTTLAKNGASFGEGAAAAALSGPNKPYQTALQPAFSAKWKCLEPNAGFQPTASPAFLLFVTFSTS